MGRGKYIAFAPFLLRTNKNLMILTFPCSVASCLAAYDSPGHSPNSPQPSERNREAERVWVEGKVIVFWSFSCFGKNMMILTFTCSACFNCFYFFNGKFTHQRDGRRECGLVLMEGEGAACGLVFTVIEM